MDALKKPLGRPRVHDKRRKPAYLLWARMKQLVLNPKASGYRYVGGRGVTMDPRWMKFAPFHEDMGDPPEGHTLKRIDVSEGYHKGNCVYVLKYTDPETT